MREHAMRSSITRTPSITLPALILGLALARSAGAQLPVETGSFRSFMGALEPSCAYDNWISHVAEGIARPGYNIYAPSTLDPQTTGFGAFEVLQDNGQDQAVLQLFADVADSLLRGREDGALARWQEGPAVDYELLRFQDTETGRAFVVLRELLDMSYTDLNNSGTADDVHGGFHHGWGIFVFDAAADHRHWLVEAPHPNDDYPSPYLATELFLERGAGLLMVNGAGREVAYTGNAGSYTNSASLSDPSRNCLTPFAVIHERAVAFWQGQGLRERTLQIHTYDDASHRNLKSSVISGGRNLRLNLPPLYDTGNGPTGLLNNLHHPVHAASSLGFVHSAVSLADFVSTQSLNTIRVDGGTPGQVITLDISPDLWGFPNSCQEADSHPAGYPDCHADENWIHMEMDELPTIGHALGFSFWYQTSSGTAVDWDNFQRSRLYFSPVFQALTQAEDSLALPRPTAAPTDPANLTVAEVGNDALRLAWTPTWSSNFASYELLVDPSGEITPDAMVLDDGDLGEFCWAPLNSVWVGGLEYQHTYAFALRARDLEGRVSGLSNPATGMADDLWPPQYQARYAAGQSRFWVQPGGGPVQLRVWDEHHQVDLGTLQVRVDQNADGAYGALEAWTPLGVTGFARDTTVTVNLSVVGTAARRVEFRAQDDQHAVWSCSGADAECGIDDDWRLAVDATPPAPISALALLGVGATGGITLGWPAQNPDSTFYSYQIALSPFPIALFEDAPSRYSRVDIAALGQPGATGVALPAQPWPGDSLFIQARMVDAAGNAGPAAQLGPFWYYSAQWLDVTLQAAVQVPLLRLTWNAESHVEGLTVTGWWLHQLGSPWETVHAGNRLLHTTAPSADISLSGLLPARWWAVTAELAFNQAVAQGSGNAQDSAILPLQAGLRLSRPRLFVEALGTLPEDQR